MFSVEELARLKKYVTILEAGGGKPPLLTPYEQKDLKQLLQKWLKENYGEEDESNGMGKTT